MRPYDGLITAPVRSIRPVLARCGLGIDRFGHMTASARFADTSTSLSRPVVAALSYHVRCQLSLFRKSPVLFQVGELSFFSNFPSISPRPPVPSRADKINLLPEKPARLPEVDMIAGM